MTSGSNTHLIPIRVDVVSKDKLVRIVDTVVLDPTCWPITLYEPLYRAIDDNVRELAHTILADAEVLGMGRTIRHFTGRIEVWTASLQKLVEHQLRPQLWHIATQTTPMHRRPPHAETLIPIVIRMIVDNKIRIEEEFHWDLHGKISPFEFAEEMARDYQLPDEATVHLATTILEQLYGLSVDPTPEKVLPPSTSQPPTPSQSQSHTKTTTKTGAWLVPPRDQGATMAHVVAHHRTDHKLQILPDNK